MKIIIIICLFVVVAGCSTFNIINAWNIQDVAPQDFKKIIVMGIIGENDIALQEKMENHLAGDLSTLGYNVKPALEAFGPKALKGMDEQSALSKLTNNGADAVLTLVLLNRKQEQYYVPQKIYYSPYGSYQNRFWDYQTVLYRRVVEPGYYVMSTVYFWESNLYRLSDQKLIYSAQSKSFDPATPESLAHQHGRLIIKDMIGRKILINKGQ